MHSQVCQNSREADAGIVLRSRATHGGIGETRVSVGLDINPKMVAYASNIVEELDSRLRGNDKLKWRE